MAWSTPPAFAVAEVVTATRMNILSDDLSYLKLSPVFDGAPVVGASGSAQSFTVWGNCDSGANGPLFVKNTSAGTIGTSLTVDASGASGGRKYSFVSTASAANIPGAFALYDSTAGAFRFAVNSVGNVIIGDSGALPPQGRLHVLGGNGGVATAGMVLGNASAVTSLQTVFAAGTVARAAAFLVVDRNNTSGAVTQNTITATALGVSSTYVNADTITIAVTAGGAVTLQRTAGTNGTHDICILAQFL
jgi:hypothetical protein